MAKPRDIRDILARLPDAKPSGDAWLASCPCPGHRTPQGHLSLRDADGKALVTCQGGKHEYHEICQAIGFDSLSYNRNEPKARIVATYDYTDAEGRLLYQVVRYEPKDFRQRRPDGNGSWVWSIRGLQTILYRQDDILKAIANRDVIFVVEGEKDCDALWDIGLVATTNPMGSGKWSDRYSDTLQGADIVIIPDNDEPGHKHALRVAASCYGKATRIRILELPEDFKDVSDWLQAGHTREDLDSLSIKSTSLYCPSDAELATERHKKVTEEVTNSEPLAKRIREWVTNTSGWFSYDDIDKEFGLSHPNEKHNRWMIVKRLRDHERILESHLSNNRLLRHIKVATRLIDFKACGNRTPLAIRYPFGIERYFQTYPGNLIAVAGAADAGKTAFLLNFIRLNMGDFSIYYQSSEMGAEELANRLMKFEGIDLQDWNFTAEERSRDFADVIRPDCINILDYLELAGEFYRVADNLKQIHDKLCSGIAIVALQKKRNAELGRGGDFGLEKPRLYLSMDAGRLVIRKAKNWVDPEVRPSGLAITFKLVNGCKFIVTDDWHQQEA